MIDHIVKDAILSKLLTKAGNLLRFGMDINASDKDFGYNSDIVSAVVDHFEEMNFLTARYTMGGGVFIQMKVKAYDFAEHGGFAGQEELLQKNIKKLLLEIESLKPAFGDKVKTITDIASGISAGLTLIHTWNK